MKAIWNGTLVAESDDTVVFEGDHYFPAQSVRSQYLLTSNSRQNCSLKGEVRFHNLFVDGDVKTDAVWYIAEPREAASELKGRMAFAHGVRIED